MNKFKSKKGFTLAELLIVVAIIAVLVAIAVPLFIGALDNAKKGVFEANMRSLRGMAVAQILSDDKAFAEDKNGNGTWIAKGWWEKDGTLHLIQICDDNLVGDDWKESTTADYKTKGTAEATPVVLKITKADIDKLKYGNS